jgi:hypothetical protein
MESSRHEGGSDVLTSSDDLYVALGVRMRERPGARWMVEIHPETLVHFDLVDFETCFYSRDVRLVESRYVELGEFRLSQRGFGLTSAGRADLAEPAAAPMVERAYPNWRKRLTRNLSRRSHLHWDPLTFFPEGRPRSASDPRA